MNASRILVMMATAAVCCCDVVAQCDGSPGKAANATATAGALITNNTRLLTKIVRFQPIAHPGDGYTAATNEARVLRAWELLKTDKYVDAMAEYLSVFDEERVGVAFATELRGAVLLEDVARLRDLYPAINHELWTRALIAYEQAMEDDSDVQSLEKFLIINWVLGAPHRNVGIYDDMRSDDPRRGLVARFLFDVFIEKQRYADALVGLDGVDIEKFLTDQTANAATNDRVELDELRMNVVDVVASCVEALLGLDDVERARGLARKLFMYCDDKHARDAIARHAHRGGDPHFVSNIMIYP